MASTPSLPQFVVIHDQTTESYKHPIVHYVFEDEELLSLDLSKNSQCIVVELSSNALQIIAVSSYSHTFQASECRVESAINMSASGGSSQTENSGHLMLKIEGISGWISAQKTEIPPCVISYFSSGVAMCLINN